MTQTSPHVELKVADDTSMRAYTALPAGPGPFPGLIVFQEAFGLNAHMRSVADRFAAEGYVVICPELFHRTAPPGFEGSYDNFDGIKPHMEAITEAGLEADMRAAWDWLQAQPQARRGATACVGYCLGGRVAFVANSTCPFRAAISYYGGRIAPDLLKRTPRLNGPMLFFWGGLDQHIPPAQVAAVTESLRQAGKPYTNVVVADANHAFFCEDRGNYNAAAARESWAHTLAFLREKLEG